MFEGGLSVGLLKRPEIFFDWNNFPCFYPSLLSLYLYYVLFFLLLCFLRCWIAKTFCIWKTWSFSGVCTFLKKSNKPVTQLNCENILTLMTNIDTLPKQYVFFFPPHFMFWASGVKYLPNDYDSLWRPLIKAEAERRRRCFVFSHNKLNV